jgi:hypothetical protein
MERELRNWEEFILLGGRSFRREFFRREFF